jgi:ligand-binding sensor domain-containing protein/signal transduction histidine kinase/CheY-like chemotaxis protein
MKTVISVIAVLSFLTAMVSALYSLEPKKTVTQYIHRSWQEEDGLPQVSVKAIRQSGNGYLWLGTEEGLARFDGIRFEIFDKNNILKKIKKNSINCLWPEQQETLWIGTEDGLLYLNRKGTSIYTTKNGLAHNKISYIIKDRNSNLWIGTENGLNRFKDGRFTTYSIRDGLAHAAVRHICEDIHGILWVSTLKGLNRIQQSGNRIKITGFTAGELSGNAVNCVYNDSAGNLWIGTNNGLMRRKFGTRIPKFFSRAAGLLATPVHTILEDKDGHIWIGTDEGLYRFRNDVFSHFGIREGLTQTCVLALFEDIEGNLWIGTKGGGLNCLGDGKFTVYTTMEGLSNNAVLPIFQDNDDSLWIGTDQGLNHMKNGNISQYNEPEGFNKPIKAILRDSKGNLWIGTFGDGLYGNKTIEEKDYDDSTNRKREYNPINSQTELEKSETTGTQNNMDNETIPPLDELSQPIEKKHTGAVIFEKKADFPNNFVRALQEDHTGNLWIGTMGGLVKMTDGSITVYSQKNGLSDDHVRVLHEDRFRNLWIGTEDGLNRYANNKFISYNPAQKDSGGTRFFSIYEDPGREGIMWFGTDRGLYRWKYGEFKRIGSEQGLCDDNVYIILPEGNHNFWFSCNKGIYRISRKDIHNYFDKKIPSVRCTLYNELDGMKSRECNASAGIVSRDDTLWFPTMKGLASIDTTNIKLNLIRPPVLLEEITADNKKYLPQQWDESSKMIFKAGTQRFEIRFTALSFSAPEKVKFTFLLDGYDKTWSDASTSRTAYYPKIPPGHYVFKVKACNNDGIWNDSASTLSFYLKPYIYQTFWFYILLALIVTITIFLLYLFRLRQLKHREKELEEMVEIWDKNLKVRNEALEAMERIIKDINMETGFENLLQSILKKALALFPDMNKGTFLIYDNKAKQFRYMAQKGYDPDELKQLSYTYEEAIERYTTNTAQLEEGLYFIDAPDDTADKRNNIQGSRMQQNAEPTASSAGQQPHPYSMLVMTLTIEGRVEGFLVLDNITNTIDYGTAAIQTLSLFREHAVSAVYKAMIMKQLETRVNERTADLLQANESLREAKEAAEKANLAKSRFLANMSHEIRTPMNAVLGFTELLLGEVSDPHHKKYLESVSSSGKTLLNLINDILDLSKIESGKMELQYEAVNPRNVLKEIESIFANNVKEKALDFIIEVAPDLPDALYLDNVRLRQILFNLVGNAVKYTDSGFVKLSVKKRGAGLPEKVDVIFSVQDSGIGIKVEQLDSIFEAFEARGHRSGKYGGTGLGLAITKRLTEMMRGDITVRSKIGKGSTFEVILKNVLISTALPAARQIKIVDTKKIRLEKATIMVADDQPMNRRLIKGYLRHHDIDIIEVKNGRLAVEKARILKPNLILMDIKMPDMDGYEATSILKNDDQLKSIPIIFLTAYSNKSHQADHKNNNADGFITKPVSKKELINLLTKYLPHSPLPTEKKHENDTGTDVPPTPPPLSPEQLSQLTQLIRLLETEFIPRCENIKKTFLLDDIEAFSVEIKDLGKQHRLTTLEEWGLRLLENVQSFDIQKISKTLEKFPKLISSIEKMKEAGGEHGQINENMAPSQNDTPQNETEA